MKSVYPSGAIEAPPLLHHAQAARVADRVNVSPEVAGLLALHAYGPNRRGDVAALHGLTASRCAMAGAR